jgi:hypothetical protein
VRVLVWAASTRHDGYNHVHHNDSSLESQLFNLLVQAGGWPDHRATFPLSRVLEHPRDPVEAAHRTANGIDFAKLLTYPALIMPEENSGDNLARIGRITRAVPRGREVDLEYTYDPEIPPISVDEISALGGQLGLGGFTLTRTHWSVKDGDLFQVLFRSLRTRRNRPTVFTVNDPVAIDPHQISVMMPFDAGFAPVYAAIQRAGQACGMNVQRADDIWIHNTIIQDVVTLIDRSRIVIAECTTKNPNVFYETGIAHTLGRDVVMITQNLEHVPFDLRHHRALHYLPNGEGLQALEARLTDRIRTLVGIPEWIP